jgi:Flp pilus assembly protein TadB
MKQYPDPDKHYDEFMGHAAREYAAGLRARGMEPNEKLTRAKAKRLLKAAQADYAHQAQAVRDANIRDIQQEHKMRMNAIKRDGARLRLLTCPPIALFALVVAYVLYVNGNMMGAIVNVVLALVFLGFLVGGAIFDRPLR